MYVAKLPEHLERPSYHFLTVTMEKIYSSIRKKKNPSSPFKLSKSPKNAAGSTKTSLILRRKSADPMLATDTFGKNRLERYKTQFCDENIPKVWIATTLKDRR